MDHPMKMYRNNDTGVTILARKIGEASTVDTDNGPINASKGDYLAVSGGVTAVIRQAPFERLYVPDDGT